MTNIEGVIGESLVLESVLKGSVVRDFGTSIEVEWYLPNGLRRRQIYERTHLPAAPVLWEGAPLLLRTNLLLAHLEPREDPGPEEIRLGSESN